MQRWNQYETVLNVNNVANLGVTWNHTGYWSSPAVANGVVYVAADNVYALNATTGANLWSSAPMAGVYTSPAVANGVVYVNSGGYVIALNASTGATLWSDWISGNGVSSPAVSNGMVYITSGSAVIALNASAGGPWLWSYNTGAYINGSPAVSNGVVYVGSFNNNVYALNASTGALLWSQATGGWYVESSPAVANGVVYVGSEDFNLYALDASTGAKLWSYPTGGTVYAAPAVANGIVYVNSNDGKVYAINASTGAGLWSYPTGGFVYSSPAVANGVVYVFSRDNNVYALNASTGAKLWSYPTGGSGGNDSSPAVSNGVVYVSAVNNIYAFSIPNSGTPSVELTPPYLGFPSGGSTLPLTVTNSGNGNLSITAAPTIIGSNANDFAVAGGTTCVGGATIPSGNSCIVEVAFTPSTESWEVATLSLFDNASYGPQTVPLSGGGQLISISPNPVPGSGSAQTVTITGTNFVAGATINWQDLTAAPWTGTITPQTVSPNTITASKTFGNASAIWQIEVVNPGTPKTTSNWYPFQVAGSGSATPSYLDDYPFKNARFDPTPGGTCAPGTGDFYSFCFRECTSYVAWRMNRDAATTDPSNPSFFSSMAGGNWYGATNWALNAAALGYKPDPSPEAGDIAIWTAIGHVAYVEQNNSDGSVDVSEYNYGADDGKIKHQYGVRHLTSALGNLPDEYIHISRLSLSPTNLDFGTQAAGTSNSQTVTVANSLAQTITLENVIVGASNANVGTTDFTKIDTCGGTSLSPGAQCDITVTFAPPTTLTSGGPRSAAIILNWGTGPQLIPVKGIALTGLTVSPKALSFGSVVIATSVSKTVTLTNSTGRDVTISSMAVSGTGFTQSSSTCGAILKWSSKCAVTVTFSPSTLGKYSGSLTIVDDAINSPQVVALTGTGVLPATLTPATATYASQAVGTTSLVKTFTLTNNQTVTLNNIAISTTGDFAVATTTCTTNLAAKGKCTVGVTFTPTATGKRVGQLSVSDSATNSPQTSSLAGTGD